MPPSVWIVAAAFLGVTIACTGAASDALPDSDGYYLDSLSDVAAAESG